MAGWTAVLCFVIGYLGTARGADLQAQARSVTWVWSGAVTESGARVVARLAPGVRRVRVSATVDRDGGQVRTWPASGYATPDDSGMAHFTLDGLAPATRYRYRVETPGAQGLEGRFRTFVKGPFSFRLAFASCAGTASNDPVFDAIRAKTPDLFVHMGDFHYLDISRNDADAFRRAFDRVLASPRQAALYRSTPLLYIFDDHDFGANDSDGTSPSGEAVRRVYRERVPHYPLEGDGVTLQQAVTIGRVRVILTDMRSARTPPVGRAETRTILGPEQLHWLETEFENARDAPLVIWVNTVPWITRNNERTDEGWAPYAHERTRLANTIERLGLTPRLVMLSGDGHMAAIDDGTNSLYTSSTPDGARGFVVAHAAPLDRWPRTKGGPYSHGVSRRNNQFGLLDVTDTGSALEVTVSARNGRGDLIRGLELRLRCERNVCQPMTEGPDVVDTGR